jgi:hypothetical protein
VKPLFRSGDKVMCVDAEDIITMYDSEPPLVYGKLYTIDGFCEEGYVYLTEPGAGGGWNLSRFVKATE